MKLRKAILFLLLITAGAVSFCVEAGGVEDELLRRIGAKPIKDRKKAPAFSLSDLNGKKVALKQYLGRVVFLNFWATWCGPCKEEMPSMEALYQEFKDKGFVFLTISVDYEGLKPVKEFLQKHRYTFPVLLDPNCDTLDPFEVKGIPTTLIIDKFGRMRARVVSGRDWKHPDVVQLLKLLMEEKG